MTDRQDLLTRVSAQCGELPPPRARVLLALALAADGDDCVDLPIDTLSLLTGLSARSVREHLGELEYNGYLRTERTPRYRITVPERAYLPLASDQAALDLEPQEDDDDDA